MLKKIKEILILEKYPNCSTGSKCTLILLNGWVLPIDGASVVKGLRLQPAQQAGFSKHTFIVVRTPIL